jgi:group I intron endonuclease
MTIGIYKLVHKEKHEKFYIGSSKNINNRFTKHKYICKKTSPTTTVYKELRADGIDNYVLEILEEMQDYDNFLLKEKEQYYISQLKPSLNTRAAYLTEEEKYLINKECWTARNKISIKCECGCTIKKSHIQRHKRTKKHRKKLIEIKTNELALLYDSFGISGGFGFFVNNLTDATEHAPADITFTAPTVLNTADN